MSVRRRLLLLTGLVPAAMLTLAGVASAQDEQTCGTFQAVCTDEIAEVNGPIVEVNDIIDFQF